MVRILVRLTVHFPFSFYLVIVQICQNYSQWYARANADKNEDGSWLRQGEEM